MASSRVAILASGAGTTAEAFIRAGAEGRIEAKVGLVICNNPDAGIFSRIDRLNKELDLDIKCRLIGRKNFPPLADEKLEAGSQTRAEEKAILEALLSGN